LQFSCEGVAGDEEFAVDSAGFVGGDKGVVSVFVVGGMVLHIVILLFGHGGRMAVRSLPPSAGDGIPKRKGGGIVERMGHG
jgi:hypothetical protein